MNDATMPALFLAHGSPMNAIEDNPFSALWQRLGRELPRPKAIVAISAHWCTQGLWATAMAQPRTLHDFGGFPPALSALRYPAPGSPALARELQSLLATQYTLLLDENGWGLDHGAWSLLVHLYPQADIPVIQLSLDPRQPAAYHYQLGQALAPLRQRGVLILGSGNVVHNLGTLRWEAEVEPYPWARRFEEVVRQGCVNVVRMLHYCGLPMIRMLRWPIRHRSTSCRCCLCWVAGMARSRCGCLSRGSSWDR